MAAKREISWNVVPCPVCKRLPFGAVLLLERERDKFQDLYEAAAEAAAAKGEKNA